MTPLGSPPRVPSPEPRVSSEPRGPSPEPRASRAADTEHYSYARYADPETARSFDDLRFGGPIGGLVASSQATVLVNMIGRINGRRILDVGTGTGRAALLLARGGASVTGVDASEPMLAIAREHAAAEGLEVTFAAGDAHALDFPDKAFEVAVSLRVLMHSPQWRLSLAELCRVAGDLVIFDVPSSRSVALLESLARRAVHRLGVNTEPYQVFSHREIAQALEALGFRIRSVQRQFVLPIALHKAIGSRRFTIGIESILEQAGLLGIFGSPVTIVAERCAIS